MKFLPVGGLGSIGDEEISASGGMNEMVEVIRAFQPSGSRQEARLSQHAASEGQQLGSIELVPVTSVIVGDSPRVGGEDAEHVELLAATVTVLPPILVHRTTMKVIDGVHRLRAAVMRGDDEISVRFFDGDEDSAFIRAVEANIAHGLPLSSADRKAAAKRIIGSHPLWSDRAVASVTGLAPSTVAAIRRRSTDQSAQLNTRVGRDGRVRPVSGAEGRRTASSMLAERPNAPLREIARAAGISVATVKDVRERLARGDDPVPPGVRGTSRRAAASSTASRDMQVDHVQLLSALGNDPAVRLTDSGRLLLRLLDPKGVDPVVWRQIATHLPAHCFGVVSRLVRARAASWERLAAEFEVRADEAL